MKWVLVCMRKSQLDYSLYLRNGNKSNGMKRLIFIMLARDDSLVETYFAKHLKSMCMKREKQKERKRKINKTMAVNLWFKPFPMRASPSENFVKFFNYTRLDDLKLAYSSLLWTVRRLTEKVYFVSLKTNPFVSLMRPKSKFERQMILRPFSAGADWKKREKKLKFLSNDLIWDRNLMPFLFSHLSVRVSPIRCWFASNCYFCWLICFGKWLTFDGVYSTKQNRKKKNYQIQNRIPFWNNCVYGHATKRFVGKKKFFAYKPLVICLFSLC